MIVLKGPSVRPDTGVYIGLHEGIYFPRKDGTGWVFIDINGKADLMAEPPITKQISVTQGEAVTLQF